MLADLKAAVEIESPSDSKPAVDRMARHFAGRFQGAGGRVRILRHATAGCGVLVEFWPGLRRQKPLLLLGHHDTVWELGMLREMPFRIHGGRAYGPGILDMKSGIIGALWALRALRATGAQPQRPVRIFLNPDEELASRAFRSVILREARRAQAVLVLEPAAAGGALKTARKGVGEFRIEVKGRLAHAGVDPAAGVNAVSELARQIVRIEGLARPERGLTLNVGMIGGGTRTNVIPEHAWASVDVRVSRRPDLAWIERKMSGLQPFHPEAKLTISGGINRPPMERRRAAALFKLAQQLGRQMSMDLSEASTGGGSDGNFTAALGIPTLDGLGGVGDGAHARHEHIIIRELPRRAALLAALIATL
jgi:glutamate carboxypeptidase